MVRTGRIFVPALLCALLVSACATSVGRVTADPSRYINRQVTISGRVVDSVSVLGRGIYRVQDGGDSLWVVSNQGVPREGARVRVRGRIQDGFDVSIFGGRNLPAGLGSGVVMIETSHQIR
jgi:membrane protein implicated in regulation of membrane protease activity